MDPGCRGLTVADVIHQLYKELPVNPPGYFAAMRAAIENLVARPEPRFLANKIRTHRRRIFQGRFIDKAGEGEQGTKWVVLDASQFKLARESQRSQELPDSADSPDSFPLDNGSDFGHMLLARKRRWSRFAMTCSAGEGAVESLKRQSAYVIFITYGKIAEC